MPWLIVATAPTWTSSTPLRQLPGRVVIVGRLLWALFIGAMTAALILTAFGNVPFSIFAGIGAYLAVVVAPPYRNDL